MFDSILNMLLTVETCLHGKFFSGIFGTNYTGNQISKNLKWKQVFIIQICKYKIKPRLYS